MIFSKILKICIYIGGVMAAVCGVIMVLGMMLTVQSLLILHQEEMSVRYIIRNIEEFEDDFAQMGFTAKIAYTWDDVDLGDYPEARQRKLGYRENGILVLRNENCEYRFDIGFDRLAISIDKNRAMVMSKNTNDELLDLKVRKSQAPVYVSFKYSDEFGNSGGGGCDYNTDFIEYYEGDGYTVAQDKEIKKYISAEELRGIYEECIALQDKLVELHKEHVRQRIASLFNKFPPEINP